MQAHLKKILALSAGASAVAILAACGGGDGDSGSTPPATNVQGKAVDFYLSGANVVFTDCNNQSTTTDAQGNFKFPDGCVKSAVRITGGTDIGTNRAFAGVLQAPAGDPQSGSLRVVTPITTLLAQGGADAAAVAAKLGLQAGDLVSRDPLTDANLIKTTVVLEQLIEQVTKSLLGLSAATGGTLTPSAAAAAAAKAIAGAVVGASGTADLTSVSLVSAAIKAGVKGVQSALPSAVQANIDAVANNTAALDAPVVAGLVRNVSVGLGEITIGANPAATLAALQGTGALNALVASSDSTLATTLVTALTADALANPALTASLGDLGSAAASGDDEKLRSVAAGLGGNVKSGVIDTVANTVKPKDFVQLNSLDVNGTATEVTDALTVGGGSLKSLKAAITQDGTPFGTGASEIRAGLSYSYQGSKVDVVIDRVILTFNGTKLVGAQVPANATYTLRTSGAVGVEASVSSRGESLSDSNGLLSLPIDTFLGKLRNSGALNASQIDALTPKAPNQTVVTVAVTGVGGKPLTVRTLSGGKGRALSVYHVDAGKAETSGYGFQTTVTLQP